MAVTTAGVAGLALILWGILHWLGIFAKTRAVLALIAAIGLGGLIGHVLARGAEWLARLTGTVTGWLLGAALPAALFIVLVIILVYDMHPRGGGAGRRTSYVAFGVGALLVAGVTGIPALAPVASALQSLPGTAAGFLNTL